MMQKLKITAVAIICIGLSGCASLTPKELKAPCGPTAGMTDPCGNRTPINGPAYKSIETTLYLNAESATTVI